MSLCVFFKHAKTIGPIELKYGVKVIFNSSSKSSYVYPEITISFSMAAMFKIYRPGHDAIRIILWFEHIMKHTTTLKHYLNANQNEN